MYREVFERVNTSSHINLLDCTIGTGAHSLYLMEKIPHISM
jgi:16S rRNA C1402 N4-methylase RsmH